MACSFMFLHLSGTRSFPAHAPLIQGYYRARGQLATIHSLRKTVYSLTGYEWLLGVANNHCEINCKFPIHTDLLTGQ